MKRSTLITRYVQKLYGILLLATLVFGACSASANPTPSSGDREETRTNEDGVAGGTSKLPLKGTTPPDACFTVQAGVITAFDRDQDDCFYKKLIIPSSIAGQSITGIGETVFQSFALTHITIPDTVQTIGNGAFLNNELIELSLGNSVATIGNGAFSINQLTELSLGNSIKTIGGGAFSINPLTTIYINPHEKLSFKENSFPDGKYLKNSFKGQNPKQIGSWVRVELTQNWNFIADDCFTAENGIITAFDRDACFYEKLVIPNTVAGQKIIEIEAFVFDSSGQSRKFAWVDLPDTVQKIGTAAFADNQFKELTLSTNVTTIGESAFSNNPLTTVYINPHEELSFEDNSFPNGASLRNSFDEQNPKQIGSWFKIEPTQKWGFIADDCFTAEDGIITAFEWDACFRKELAIPGKIKEQRTIEIGAFVFDSSEQARGFTWINLPDTVQKIGTAAFADNQLKEINLGNKVTTIGESAFSSNKLTKLSLGTSVTTIGNYAFSNNKLSELTIDNNVKTIGDGAFSSNHLTKLIIGNTVKAINDYTFSNNRLKELTLGRNVETIGDAAFFNNRLTELIIPNWVSAIGDEAFLDNHISGMLVISDNVQKIGAKAFKSNQITELVFSKSVEAIGSKAFFDNPLTRITIDPSNKKGLDFEDDSFPDGRLLKKRFDAQPKASIWSWNTIEWVYYPLIPDRCFTVQDRVRDMARNKVLSVSITAFDWEGRACFQEMLAVPSIINGQRIYNIAKGVFSSQSSRQKFTSLSLSHILLTINEQAFYNNALTELTLPDSVTVIGESAFSHNELTKLTLPERIAEVWPKAFFENQITDLTFSNSVRGIGTRAFYANPLTRVTINPNTDSNTRVNFNFNSFPNGESLSIGFITEQNSQGAGIWSWDTTKWNYYPLIPDRCFTVQNGTITAFNYSACFQKALAIPRVVNGQIITKIGTSAFNAEDGGRRLTSLSLPNTLQEIGPSAFYWNKLTILRLPNSLRTIGGHAFYKNHLAKLTIPDGVVTINWRAFNHNLLEEVSISKSVKAIKGEAFSLNKQLDPSPPSYESNPERLRTVIIDPHPDLTLENNSFPFALNTSFHDLKKQLVANNSEVPKGIWKHVNKGKWKLTTLSGTWTKSGTEWRFAPSK